MKFYYFDLYARGEPIRMALHKAGVAYEDVRPTGESWMELKNSGKLEFGQMPALELDDGTFIVQGLAILHYIGAKHNLLPADPLVRYQGESFALHAMEDFFGAKISYALFRAPEDQREKAKADALTTDLPNFLQRFDARLQKSGTKFLCGDSITVYDFIVGGLFTNWLCNPNAKWAAELAPIWEGAPESIKVYVAAFKDELKDYLENRVQDSTV